MMEWLGLPIAILVITTVAKYACLDRQGEDYFWSPMFFGKRTAFLMNLIPFVPELIMMAMSPFWVIYWLMRGVGIFTRYVDKKWGELGE